ncbi:hypothetical protein GC169_08290 [bacterium]|nr:hypothetical protein [bacterium]
MSLFSSVIDILLSCLLVIAIAYCWRLDQRLKTLRQGRDGLIEAARELQQSVAQAEAAIGGLRAAADASGRDLQARIDEARGVAQLSRPREDSGLRKRSMF